LILIIHFIAGKVELLIDFESPKENGRGGYVERPPLIPCPRLSGGPGDNPFDFVFTNINQPPDPFTPVKVCPKRGEVEVKKEVEFKKEEGNRKEAETMQEEETKKEEESIPELTHDTCLETFKEVIRKRVRGH
jgi:hypothetical protein